MFGHTVSINTRQAASICHTGTPPRGRRVQLAAALCAVIALTPPALALDFELQTVSVSEDGFTHDRTCFRYDGDTNVMIDLPRGWSISANAACIGATAAVGDASIRMEKSPLTPATPWREKGLDMYRQRILGSVPQGALNVRIVQEQADPLPVFHWKDYEFVIDYDFYGRALRRSAMFVNLNAVDQILVSAVSTRDAFQPTHEAALDMLRSWTPVPAR